MKTVIFTGAGAGKADGLPLQTQLFKVFFDANAGRDDRRALVATIVGFFLSVFHVDPRTAAAASLPTFEEALGILDLAISRDEVVLPGDAHGIPGEIWEIRRALILALAATITPPEAPGDGTTHARLVARLRDAERLADTTFVTTNYDTLIEDALDLEAIAGDRGTGSVVDYGIGDLLEPESDPHAETQRFSCYKIHGSLNWLLCPACDELNITYANGVIRLVDDPDSARCHNCETIRTPIIVPPSYYKNMSSVYLSVVWNKAYRAIRSAERLVFCGYSFPDADMHIKYMVKRAQENRGNSNVPLRVMVVNNYQDKATAESEIELARFRRFLGEAVEDTGLSFEDFATEPARVLT